MESCSNDYAALVGVDWADREHAWCLQGEDAASLEFGSVAHTPEALEQWAVALGQRFAGKRIAIALEQSRGALLFALTKYGHFVHTQFTQPALRITARVFDRRVRKMIRVMRNSC